MKVGDRVLLPEYGGTDLSAEGEEEELTIVEASNILAVFEN